MAVLYRTALGTKDPGGIYLLQILQNTFFLEVPWEFTLLLQPGLFYLWKPRPLAPHICIIQWNILWVIHSFYWRGFIQTSVFLLKHGTLWSFDSPPKLTEIMIDFLWNVGVFKLVLEGEINELYFQLFEVWYRVRPRWKALHWIIELFGNVLLQLCFIPNVSLSLNIFAP